MGVQRPLDKIAQEDSSLKDVNLFQLEKYVVTSHRSRNGVANGWLEQKRNCIFSVVFKRKLHTFEIK